MTSTISVATWNLRWRFDDWEQRQGPILNELRSLDADIVTVQESWPDQVNTLAEALGYHSFWAGREPQSDDDSQWKVGFGNGVLSRWPIVHQARHMLADGEGRRYRSIVHALVETPQRPLGIFTTHLEHRYAHTHVRQEQLDEALRFAETLGGDDRATVLTGDLNATPDSDEIRRLTGRSTPYVEGSVWTDAWEVVGEGHGHTWSSQNPWLPNATWPNRRLDYVLVQWPRVQRPIGNPIAVRRFGVDAHGGVVPSDHYGVVADLAW